MSRFLISAIITITVLTASLILFPSPWNLWISVFVALLFLIVIGLGVAFIQLNFFQHALCRDSTNSAKIALTFDDGPDPDTTEFLLDTLASHGIHATFFCVGECARKYPDIVRRIVDEGHLIGNHTMHHRWNTNFLFGRKLEKEIAQAQLAIREVSGTMPKYFRPPMGLTNPHYRNLLEKLGLKLTGWDVRSLDLNTDDPEVVLQRILTRVRSGSIILMHDSGQTKEFLREVLMGLIEHMRNRNFRFVTVDKLQD